MGHAPVIHDLVVAVHDLGFPRRNGAHELVEHADRCSPAWPILVITSSVNISSPWSRSRPFGFLPNRSRRRTPSTGGRCSICKSRSTRTMADERLARGLLSGRTRRLFLLGKRCGRRACSVRRWTSAIIPVRRRRCWHSLDTTRDERPTALPLRTVADRLSARRLRALRVVQLVAHAPNDAASSCGSKTPTRSATGRS